MQGIRVGAVGSHFYGRSARDILREKEQAASTKAAEFNNSNPPANSNAAELVKIRKRKASNSLSDKINKQNIQTLASSTSSGGNASSSSSFSQLKRVKKYDPSSELPKESGKLLESPEGVDELGKLIAITEKQKTSHKAFKAKRKEYEQYLLNYQKQALEKEAKKLQKQKQKLLKAPASSSQRQSSARSSSSSSSVSSPSSSSSNQSFE